MAEDLPDNIGSCLSLLCQQLWVVHHFLQEANYTHFQLWVQLKVLQIDTKRTTVSSHPIYCISIYQIYVEKQRSKKVKKLHLWMFGDPVAQNIQHSVGGSSSNDKLFVPVPLISRKTWEMGNQCFGTHIHTYKWISLVTFYFYW